jgi:hypothetical protein
MSAGSIESFIARWSASAAAERANKDLFLTGLCDADNAGHPRALGASRSRRRGRIRMGSRPPADLGRIGCPRGPSPGERLEEERSAEGDHARYRTTRQVIAVVRKR